MTWTDDIAWLLFAVLFGLFVGAACEPVVAPPSGPAVLYDLPYEPVVFTIHEGQQQSSPFLTGTTASQAVRFRFRFHSSWAADWRGVAGEGSGKLLRIGTGPLDDPVGDTSIGFSFSAGETSATLRLYAYRAGVLHEGPNRVVGTATYDEWHEAEIDPAAGCVRLAGQESACVLLPGPWPAALNWAGPYYGGRETPAPWDLHVEIERLR